MKNRFMMILVILLPLTLGCAISTVFPTPTAQPPVHFENELVAFDYPAGARIFAALDTAFNPYSNFYQLGGDLVIGFANQSWMDQYGTLYSSIGIFRHAQPAGSSLEDVMQAAYATNKGPSPEEVPEQSGAYSLDGRVGVRKTYRFASGPLWYTFQDIWLKADGSILRISLNMEAYEADFQAASDLFLDSLNIQENLPPFTEQPTPAPTALPTRYPSALLTHYDDNQLAFDYPQGLIILTSWQSDSNCFPDIHFGGEWLVGLGEPRFLVSSIYYHSIQITRLPMSSGSNLEAVMLNVYEQAQARFPQEPSTLATTGSVSIAGQTGFQWAYRVTTGEPTYELRDIWLELDNQFYIISIWTEYTNPDDFWAFQSGAQALLDSLAIK
jgi:hypothetical protein